MNTSAGTIPSTDHASTRRRGILLVAGSALVWSFGGAITAVITRRHASVRMTPDVCLGATMAACFAGLSS